MLSGSCPFMLLLLLLTTRKSCETLAVRSVSEIFVEINLPSYLHYCVNLSHFNLYELCVWKCRLWVEWNGFALTACWTVMSVWNFQTICCGICLIEAWCLWLQLLILTNDILHWHKQFIVDIWRWPLVISSTTHGWHNIWIMNELKYSHVLTVQICLFIFCFRWNPLMCRVTANFRFVLCVCVYLLNEVSLMCRP